MERPGARHNRDVEDFVAFMPGAWTKTTVTKLLRCSWEAVANIVGRRDSEKEPPTT